MDYLERALNTLGAKRPYNPYLCIGGVTEVLSMAMKGSHFEHVYRDAIVSIL